MNEEQHMLNIGALHEGVVMDHIPSGRAMDIYKRLKLDKMNCQIAMIMHARSNKMGQKDIIKIEAPLDQINLDALGFIDHTITVNIIREDRIVEKRKLNLPRKLVNIIHCKNPRCITSIEQGLDHVFYLADEKNEIYRCLYCDEKWHGTGRHK